MLSISKRIYTQALKIVQDLALVDNLENAGDVYFVGGLALNLMIKRDIDLIILMDKLCKEEVYNSVDILKRHPRISAMVFRSRLAESDVLNRRFYVHAGYVDKQNNSWTIDLAFWHKDSWDPGKTRDLCTRLNYLKNNITPKMRAAILNIKFQLQALQKEGRQNTITGNMIYDAVLHHHVNDLKQFLAHRRRLDRNKH